MSTLHVMRVPGRLRDGRWPMRCGRDLPEDRGTTRVADADCINCLRNVAVVDRQWARHHDADADAAEVRLRELGATR